MNRVAVESNLSHIQEYLSKKGYEVDTLDASNINQTQNNYTAVIISGTDQNVMGIHNMAVDCPTINAHGLTPEQVYDRLQQSK